MSFILTLALMAATALPPAPSPASAENAACLACHTTPARTAVAGETYGASPHGILSCERCHSEAAGPGHARDPNRPLGLPQGREGRAAYSARCLKCHAAVKGSYEKSFHGVAVRAGDLRAATCVDCHGVHDVFGAKDYRSPVHPGRVAATCGAADCHPGAPQNFAAGREHIDPTKPGQGTDRALHLVWKFFVALILFDTLKDGPIVMFELLRRIRG